VKYILLIYGDQKAERRMSQDEMEKIYAGHRAYGEAMTKAGVMRGAELKPVTTATTIRFGQGANRRHSTVRSLKRRNSSVAIT